MLRLFYLATFLGLLSACSPIVDTSQKFADDGTFDIQKSIEYLDKIIDHDRDNAVALYQRATLEMQLSRTIKAKEDVVAALEEDPLNLDYLLLKAKVDDRLGQTKEALQTIEFIQEKGLPITTVEAQLFVSDMYLKSNNLNKSEYYLQKAASNVPQFAPVIFQRAKFYAASHDTMKAMGFYKQLLAKDSTHEGGLLGLSEIYLKIHEPDSALQLLAKVGTSHNYIYNVLIAQSLTQKNLPDSAAIWWGNALVQAPRLPEAHYELGKYDYKKEDYPSARSHLASIPENERSKFKDYELLYARVSESLSDSAMAAYYYKKAFESDSNLVKSEEPASKTEKKKKKKKKHLEPDSTK